MTLRKGRHALVGLLRQSVFRQLAGYEDVNDAERLRQDPAMRWIVGGKAASGAAASPSQMGRFETRCFPGNRLAQRLPIFPGSGSAGSMHGVRSQKSLRRHPAHDRSPTCGRPLLHRLRRAFRCHASGCRVSDRNLRERCTLLPKNFLSLRPHSRIGPPESLPARRPDPVILSTGGNQASVDLAPASIWGMTVK